MDERVAGGKKTNKWQTREENTMERKNTKDVQKEKKGDGDK